MSHRALIVGISWLLYFGIALFGLALFDAGVLLSQMILFGIPALVLLRWTHAPSPVVVAVTAFGFGLGVILEGVAYFYGLWSSGTAMGLASATIFPIETVLSIMMQTLFLTLCYEILFDDIEFTVRSARQRLVFFFVFSISALGLITIHYILAPGWNVSYSYAWIIGSMIVSALLALMLQKQLSVPVFDKVIDFCLVAALPLGSSLWLAAENSHKLFLTEEDYLATVYFFGHYVPLEEIALLFVLPFLVASVYEMYLDDKT